MLRRSIVVQSLRSIRDRFFDTIRQRNEQSDGQGPGNVVTGPSLDNVPVDMQFLIMTFLSPQDLCRLGGTSTYWRSMVRDPVLWKYFLLRDMPLWQSVDHLSVPQVKLTGSAVLDDSEMQLDYMAEYLRVCPACRNQWQHQPRVFESVTSFFQSLVPVSEPQFAMFGPGLEQLEISLMNTIMCSPHVLPVAGLPQRQIDGAAVPLLIVYSSIGSGISFKYKDQHRFNIATLYSTNRSVRERARLEHLNLRSKLFVYEEDSESNIPLSINPMFNQVCQAVNGFIFVVNAETERGTDRGWEEESAQIRVILDPAVGALSHPILVLSCVSRETADSRRIPCVTVAHQLQLGSLTNPWMVQDTAAETLTGLLDGIDWLLRHSGVML
ncbi:F-box only protein 4-like isoform X2 [Sinocyclocheilus rhinocerous]|uniref:F-box only protein 4-like isoform X2 n=1 Tax=Sinocyclocheilus rhinocerous TaxID=307959 RepID=UPI0007B8F9AD|nr:PREDICTED: F-box only protein 4-like isoform X2 [Sinocyclocheilus rhinocerous]